MGQRIVILCERVGRSIIRGISLIESSKTRMIIEKTTRLVYPERRAGKRWFEGR